MNRFDHQWEKLTALARSAPADRSAAAPYGFATRVAARAATAPGAGRWAPFEHLALRGLVVAGACSVAAVIFDFATGPAEQTDAYAASDSIGELLDLS